MNSWGVGDMERRLANLVKIGTISAVDNGAKRIRVEAGGMTSAWIPWPVEVGANFRRWRPLRAGQQVVMVAPSGELAQAAVVGLLYSNSLDAPSSDPDVDLVLFDDGTRIEYNSGSSQLTVDCVGDVTVRTPTQVTVDAPQSTFTGAVTVQGLFTYQAGMTGSGGSGATATINGNIDVVGGDVTADGISLKQHTHREQGDGEDTSPAQ